MSETNEYSNTASNHFQDLIKNKDNLLAVFTLKG